MEQACKVGIRKIMDNAKNLRIASSVQCATRNQKRKLKKRQTIKRLVQKTTLKSAKLDCF